MWHNLSLKKTSRFTISENESASGDDLDLTEPIAQSSENNVGKKKSPDLFDQETETVNATNTIVDIMKSENKELASLTQPDLRNTSLKLGFKSAQEQENTFQKNKGVMMIEEKFEKRHHIATLAYVLECSKNTNKLPTFLRTNIEFFPYFGSNEAKSFFMEKIKDIRKEMTNMVMEKLFRASEEFANQMTKEAEEIRDQLAYELNNSGEEQSKCTAELSKLNEKFTTMYNKFVNRHNKASAVKNEKASAIKHDKLSKSARKAPYHK